MIDIIILVILVVGIGISVVYIAKEKKRGVRCIGCPSAGTCHKKACGCYSNTGLNE